MRLLYGTENAAKIRHMKNILQGLNIEIIGQGDISIKVGNVDESGNSPEKESRIFAGFCFFGNYIKKILHGCYLRQS